MRNGQAHAQAGGHVRAQLCFHASGGGQRADRGQLAALPVQVVAFEDGAEQVCLQVLVDDRREVEQRAFDDPARDRGLVVRGKPG